MSLSKERRRRRKARKEAKKLARQRKPVGVRKDRVTGQIDDANARHMRSIILTK